MQIFFLSGTQVQLKATHLSHFSTKVSLMDFLYCSRTVFGEGKTSSGIFQFSGFRLKGTMRYIDKNAVQVNAEACFWSGYESIMLQNQGFTFYSLISGSAWEQEEVCNS